jgi:hypothetical protein
MSNIPERQNDEELLRCLAAQRQLYTEDKRWGYGWMLAVAITSTIGVLWQLGSPQAVPFVNSVTLAVAIIGVIMPMFSKWRIEAAGVQEIFDCDLLGLKWNDALAEKPADAVIEGAVLRVQRRRTWANVSESLRNWYENPAIRRVELPAAAIACQVENTRYSQRLRRWWAWFLVAASALLFVSLLLVGLAEGWNLGQVFREPILLLSPLLLAALQNAVLHFQAAGNWERLQRLAQLLWHDAQAGHLDDAALQQAARALQNEIYHVRRYYLPVPDWWYKLLKRFNPPPAALPS